MTTNPPDQAGAAPADPFGAAPSEPQAPDFGTDPYGRPAADTPAFGTDPDGASAAPAPGTVQQDPWQQPAAYPPQGAYPPPGAYAPQQYPPGPWGPGVAGTTCAACGNPVGATVHCVNCNQMVGMPMGYTLATPGERFLQALLEVGLSIVTLGIGYLIWSLIVWQDGQTPGMRIMHLRCVRKLDRSQATWGTMALRQIVGGILQAILDYIIVGIVLLFMILWDKDRQMLWDKVAGTVVIKDPPGGMVPPPAAQLPYQT
jgi:uncharacterized RDD family membrane protein YckC